MYTALAVAYAVVTCFFLFILFKFRSEEKQLRSRGLVPDYPPIWWCIAFSVMWPLTLFLLCVLGIASLFSSSDKDDEKVETGKITL
jgi:hypothetical protein